jgi:hypothetical protein
MHEMKTKPNNISSGSGREKKQMWMSACCALHTTALVAALVRSSNHRFTYAKSNGWMSMHSYHGGYPTISHINNP